MHKVRRTVSSLHRTRTGEPLTFSPPLAATCCCHRDARGERTTKSVMLRVVRARSFAGVVPGPLSRARAWQNRMLPFPPLSSSTPDTHFPYPKVTQASSLNGKWIFFFLIGKKHWLCGNVP